jgi:hypothetical protein
MDKIQTIKFIDSNGRVFGLRPDSVTGMLPGIDYAHHKIHEGCSFSVSHYEADFDKVDIIGVLFTTPNTLNRIHMFPIIYAGAASLFEICEGPTVDAGNYPTVFSTPINRDRNSSNTSGVLSVRATPVVNRVSLKRPIDVSPVTVDGTIIHAEVIGSSKQGGGSGGRDNNEYILKRNTTYYFRLSGTAGGADNSVGSIILSWYKHASLE